MNDHRRLERLSRSQALELLSSVPIGRLVFTHQALPAIRPVNHLVEGESIVVRTTSGATITTVAGRSGAVVAYEADSLDTARQVGWSVIIVGTARLLEDEAAAERYRSLLTPWLSGAMDDVIVIAADIVTGFEMVPGDPADCGQVGSITSAHPR
ncbi:MAG TPA: pyridoxamine 5'-phosphate oxidase family protein [Streptosporangiaceae bacterium]|nr:pyridoxamine 5'-phosphate oxidase family protein [Streptosporangiaceae bacterium]